MLALADHFALAADDGTDLRRLGDFSVDGTVFRFNDGKPDPWGSMWAGTCTLADKGPPCALYRLSPGGSVAELFGGIGLSNGLDWTGDRRTFVRSLKSSGRTIKETKALISHFTSPDGELIVQFFLALGLALLLNAPLRGRASPAPSRSSRGPCRR